MPRTAARRSLPLADADRKSACDTAEALRRIRTAIKPFAKAKP
jgi:hypothetical protein